MAKKNMKRCPTSMTVRETQVRTTMRYCLRLIRMAVIKKTRNSVDDNVEKRELLCTAGINENWQSHYRK